MPGGKFILTASYEAANGTRRTVSRSVTDLTVNAARMGPAETLKATAETAINTLLEALN